VHVNKKRISRVLKVTYVNIPVFIQPGKSFGGSFNVLCWQVTYTDIE
jgi:hypothetical protein